MHPKRPLVVRVAWAGGDALLSSAVAPYTREMLAAHAAATDGADEGPEEWALLEGATRDDPPVLLGSVAARFCSGSSLAESGAERFSRSPLMGGVGLSDCPYTYEA